MSSPTHVSHASWKAGSVSFRPGPRMSNTPRPTLFPGGSCGVYIATQTRVIQCVHLSLVSEDRKRLVPASTRRPHFLAASVLPWIITAPLRYSPTQPCQREHFKVCTYPATITPVCPRHAYPWFPTAAVTPVLTDEYLSLYIAIRSSALERMYYSQS